jgi:hypothetical protein
MYRLESKAALLVYEDSESENLIFLSRWKKGGKPIIQHLKSVYEDKFGKFKKVE